VRSFASETHPKRAKSQPKRPVQSQLRSQRAAEAPTVETADEIVSKHLKKFMLRVHPDLFQGADEFSKRNTESLATLNSILAFARADASQTHDLSLGVPTVPLKQTVRFFIFGTRKKSAVEKDLEGTLAAAAFADDSSGIIEPDAAQVELDLPEARGLGLNLLSYVHFRVSQLFQQAGVAIPAAELKTLRASWEASKRLLDRATAARERPPIIKRARPDEELKYILKLVRETKMASEPNFGGDITPDKLNLVQALLPLLLRHGHITFHPDLLPAHRWRGLNNLQTAIVNHFADLNCVLWPPCGVRLELGNTFPDPATLIRPSKAAQSVGQVRALLKASARGDPQMEARLHQLESMVSSPYLPAGAPHAKPLPIPWKFEISQLVTYMRMYLDVLTDGQSQGMAVRPGQANAEAADEKLTDAQRAHGRQQAMRGKLSPALTIDVLEQVEKMMEDGTVLR
jgi:hypothetical protein